MHRSVLFAGMLVQVVPTQALAQSVETPVFVGTRLSIESEVRSSARGARHDATFRHDPSGSGDRGWALAFQSAGGHSASDGRFYETRKVRGQQAAIKFWRDLGPNVTAGVSANAARTSRLDRLSPVFPGKSLSGSFELGGYVRLDTGLALRGGWFSHGGWGGRSFERDVVRMVNGDSAAETGMRMSLEMPVTFESAGSAMLAVEARSGSTWTSGAPVQLHASEVALRLASAF